MTRTLSACCAVTLLLAHLTLTPLSAAPAAGLIRWLEAEVSRLPGRVSVYVKHLGTGEEAGVRDTEAFNSMSVIKVPIMVRAFQLVEQGKLSLDTRVTLTRAHLRDGTGVLQYHDLGLAPTLRDLITEMIITSDNTATDAMTLAIGGVESLNAWLRASGYPNMKMVGRGFEYRRKLLALLDPAFAELTPEETTGLMYASSESPLFDRYESLFQGPRRAWVDEVREPATRERLRKERFERVSNDAAYWLGSMTTRDIGRMLEAVERDTIASPESCRQMKRILRAQQLGVRRIPHYLDVPVGHKTGDNPPGIGNDVGIVYARSGPIVMAVFTRSNSTPVGEFEDSLGRIARGIVDYFDGAPAR